MTKPNCLFCQGQLAPRGCLTGSISFNVFIYYCPNCDAQQSYTEDNVLIGFHFDVITTTKYSYWIQFDAILLKLTIIQRYYDGYFERTPIQISKLFLETKLRSFPDWLAPGKLTEHRIQTLKVFS